MQFQVPQFIETEAKLVGPLTLRQFLYLAAAAGVSVIGFYMFQVWLWLFSTAVVGTIALGIAFVKVNGRPLIVLMKSIMRYLWSPKFYLWQRGAGVVVPPTPKLPSVAAGGGSPLNALLLKLTTTTHAITKRELPNPLSLLKARSAPEDERTEILRRSTGEREAARRVDYR